MSRSGSSGWVRCFLSLVLLLEFMTVFSIGSAVIPTETEHRDEIVSESSIATSVPSTSNSPALQEVHFRQKDHISPEGLSSQYPVKALSLMRKFIAALMVRAQFATKVDNSPVPDGVSTGKSMEKSIVTVHHDDDEQVHGTRPRSRSSRRLMRGARGLGKGRGIRARLWATKQRQGRKVGEVVAPPAPATSSTPTPDEQTQQFFLGPPAPPGLVHNEKQDWNQDYAEPDVHPPSSN